MARHWSSLRALVTELGEARRFAYHLQKLFVSFATFCSISLLRVLLSSRGSLLVDFAWRKRRTEQRSHSMTAPNPNALPAVQRSLPVRVFTDLVTNWYLIRQFLERDISSRYRGTFFGLFWSFLSPLLMLAIYLFVFGLIFKSRFGVQKNESTFDFGLALFCGLNFFNLFSEVVLRSPTLVLQYPNFVKKVVFPLEILPVVATGTAIFHCLIAFLPLAIGLSISRHEMPFTVLYLFVFLVPLALLTCGASWIFAATGVFFRDIQPVLTAAITILMFMSAIFFPLQAVPETVARAHRP